MRWIYSIVLLAATTFVAAQESVPAGMLIPVALQTTISSARTKQGDTISARVMQDVLTPHGVIRRGSRLIGHVVQVSTNNGGPASVTLQFDTIREAGRDVPVTTVLRAMASYMAVEEAQIPPTGPDEGTPTNAWTTVQIGGDVVYRGGGPVASGLEKVGKPVNHGVLSQVTENPEGQCRGEIDGNNNPQSLWVFSSAACGTYGLSNVHIVKKGISDPAGNIVLASHKGTLHLARGTGMVLRVITPSVSRAQM
jgi:hypothetical protein